MSLFPLRMLGALLLTVLGLVQCSAAHPVAAQADAGMSGRVIHDLDGDGVLDPDEPGLPDYLLLLEGHEGLAVTPGGLTSWQP